MLYAVRVELRGPPSRAVYEQLHDTFLAAGLIKLILGDDGRIHNLPDGIYVGSLGASDAIQMRDLVRVLVNRVWVDHELIVFRYDEAAWVLPLAA